MYCKYVNNAGATIAAIIQDICALCTGAPISSLSASCNQLASSLVSTVAPGWTLLDAAAPTSSRVLTSPDADALTTKYLRVASNVSNLAFDVYELWNAVAHTGTNPSVITSNANSVAINITGGGTTHIFATPRSIVIANNVAFVCCLEISRDAQYLQGTTYPVAITGSSNNMNAATVANSVMSMSRVKNISNPGDSLGAAAFPVLACISPKFSVAGISGPLNVAAQAADGSYYHEVKALWVALELTSGTPQSTVIAGKLFDLVETTRNAGNAADIMLIDGNEWMMLPQLTVNQMFMMRVA